MICTYERGGGMAQPSDNELLEIENDGSFTMWRSVGWATVPPTPVGRFAGQVNKNDLRLLKEEAGAASGAGDLSSRMQPGIPVETIETEGASAEVTPGRDIPGPWGKLVEHLRELLGSLADQPAAALALEVAGDRQRARLVHLGDDPLRLDLGEVTLHVSQQSQTGAGLGEWRLPATDLGGEITAEAGWSIDLPFDHGLTLETGSSMTVVANLVAFDEDGLAVPVSLAASPAG